MNWRGIVSEVPAPSDATLISDPPEGGFCQVALHIDSDGNYNLGFHVTINGSERTLSEVEDFAIRVRSFIDAEPVCP